MNSKFLYAALFFLSSCTAAKLAVPDQFRSQATGMPVKGLNGWMINQQLNFGQYSTTNIKRGWDFTASVLYTKFNIKPEEALLKVFDINTDRNNNYQKNKFQYSINDGKLYAEVFATEKFSEKQLVYKSNNPYIGNASKTNKYEYAFTASIVPYIQKEAPWSLVLINKYDIAKDTARKLFDNPYMEEEGYATNGKENISIRPLRIDKTTTKNGTDKKVFGGNFLSGYELKWDDGVVAVIDILDNKIWMYNELKPSEKLIIAAISSSIMLKRMQDVQKDKDSFSN
jgi:hypothetical protein